MLIGIITDLHYGIRNDSPLFHDYQKKSNELFFQVLRERGIKDIICLGDLYDRKKYVNYVTASRCRKDFLDIVNSEFKMTVIAGNHDIYHKNDSGINALQELVIGKYSNIECLFEPMVKMYDGTEILMLPWINQSNYKKSMEMIQSTKAHVAFGHLEFDGFEMDKGIINHGGQDSEIFSKFELVASGHFHHRSIKKNIQYIGAAYEFTWADWNDPRGFSIFDTETRKMEFIQIPYNMFNMVVYDDVNGLDAIKNIDVSVFKDTYVRVVVVKKTDPYVFDGFLDKIYAAEPMDITIIEDNSLFSETEENDMIDQGENTLTTLNKYIDGLSMETDSYKVKEIMLDIYMEAVSVEETSAR